MQVAQEAGFEKHRTCPFSHPQVKLTIKNEEMPYFAVYNAHFFAQMFAGKIKMCIIHENNVHIIRV